MATYVIGDVQGCFEPLMGLLKIIEFNEQKDFLWFTGDLVNRGPHSLKVLRFVKGLGLRALTVLGNHDLTLLAVAHNQLAFNHRKHNFQDILQASDREELLTWLIAQPLAHYDALWDVLLIHAGLAPQWSLDTALSLAREYEAALLSPLKLKLLAGLYEPCPLLWDNKLDKMQRLQFINRCFTHMRFLTPQGAVNLEEKGPPHRDTALIPWFDFPNPEWIGPAIVFGHWAALQGQCALPKLHALDTGCVWGRALTALRLEDRQRFEFDCSKVS